MLGPDNDPRKSDSPRTQIANFVTFRDKIVTIEDIDASKRIVEFNGDYLYLESRPR